MTCLGPLVCRDTGHPTHNWTMSQISGPRHVVWRVLGCWYVFFSCLIILVLIILYTAPNYDWRRHDTRHPTHNRMMRLISGPRHVERRVLGCWYILFLLFFLSFLLKFIYYRTTAPNYDWRQRDTRHPTHNWTTRRISGPRHVVWLVLGCWYVFFKTFLSFFLLKFVYYRTTAPNNDATRWQTQALTTTIPPHRYIAHWRLILTADCIYLTADYIYWPPTTYIDHQTHSIDRWLHILTTEHTIWPPNAHWSPNAHYIDHRMNI
jgi:hypothetical protein